MATEQTPNPVKSLQKALALLERLALGDLRRQGVTLTQLAQELDLPPNTAHNLLKTLVGCGYAAKLGRGRYVAGPKVTQLARATYATHPLTGERIRRALQHFAEKEGEACVCATLIDGERVLVGAVDSSQAVRVAHATVEAIPFFAKPTGRLLAALAEPAELTRILERHGLPREHWDGIADEAALQRALAHLRQQGYCEVEETALGVVALASPVTAADGRHWGVVGTFAPAFRCKAAQRRHLRSALLELAALLAEELQRTVD